MEVLENVLTFEIDKFLRIDPKSIINSSFLVNGDDNVNYFLVKILDKSINNVSVTFKRHDSKVLGSYALDLFEANENYNIFKFVFDRDARILAVSGELGLSLTLKETREITTSPSVTYTDVRTKATPTISLHVRKALDSSAEDITIIEVIANQVLKELENVKASLHSEVINRTEADRVEKEAREAEDTRLNEAINKEIIDRDTADANLSSFLQEKITQEATARQEQDALLSDDINTALGLINENTQDLADHKGNKQNPHETNGENAFISANSSDTIKNYIDTKNNLNLLKSFSDLAVKGNIADDDYFVTNVNGVSYKITANNLKAYFGGGGGGDSHYKGDYLTIEALRQAHPTAEPGDYAFINTASDLILVVWDADDNQWKETTSGHYVTIASFNELQNGLLNGTVTPLKSKEASDYTAGGSIESGLNSKVAKANEKAIVYGTNEQGQATTIAYNKTAVGGGLAQRNNDGTLAVANGTQPTDAVNLTQLSEKTNASYLASKLQGDETFVFDLAQDQQHVEGHLDQTFKQSLATKTDLASFMPKYNYKGNIWENEFYQWCLNTPNVDNGSLFSVELLNETTSEALTRGFPMLEAGSILYGYFYLGQLDNPIVLMSEKGNLKIIDGTSNLTCEILGGFGVEAVKITQPAEATNGNLTSEQLATLQKNDLNYIFFNNEIYRLNDKTHTADTLTYSHVGFENNKHLVKTISVTISTKAWVMNKAEISKGLTYEEV